MSKKRDSLSSLGELTATPLKGSAAGLIRLASPHPLVRHIVEVVERLQARPYTTNALISGEAGTGKEGLAHTLHELMHGEDAPLITVSTLGRDEYEVAAELFGAAPQQKGERPFDGAVAEADGGTLVLDELIGMSAQLQRRLLELVKRGRYHREGEIRERRTQVTIIAITDGDLRAEVTAGRFRHDLYYKLARLDLVLPPLRERPEDIPSAITWMANRLLSERGVEGTVANEGQGETGDVIFKNEAIDALKRHAWPGNFRELETVIERALLLYSNGKQVSATDVTRGLLRPAQLSTPPLR